MGLILNHSHDHAHSTSASYEHSSVNIKAAFIHVLGDLLQSIGVLVAAVVIWWKPEWRLADPICTFLFSIIVIASTVMLVKEIVVTLMEGKLMSYFELY